MPWISASLALYDDDACTVQNGVTAAITLNDCIAGGGNPGDPNFIQYLKEGETIIWRGYTAQSGDGDCTTTDPAATDIVYTILADGACSAA